MVLRDFTQFIPSTSLMLRADRPPPRAGWVASVSLAPPIAPQGVFIIVSRSAGGDFEDGVPRGKIKKGVPKNGTPQHEAKVL